MIFYSVILPLASLARGRNSPKEGKMGRVEQAQRFHHPELGGTAALVPPYGPRACYFAIAYKQTTHRKT